MPEKIMNEVKEAINNTRQMISDAISPKKATATTNSSSTSSTQAEKEEFQPFNFFRDSREENKNSPYDFTLNHS